MTRKPTTQELRTSELQKAVTGVFELVAEKDRIEFLARLLAFQVAFWHWESGGWTWPHWFQTLTEWLGMTRKGHVIPTDIEARWTELGKLYRGE